MKGPARRPIADRFWPKVRKSDGCWEWTASKYHGYGQIGSGGYRGRPLRASRVSWELHNGLIPEGLDVCHHCDNPGCVRPDHLFLGTRGDNMRDMTTKRRQARGAAIKQARLVAEQVQQIRERYAAGDVSQAALAREFGISQQNVSWIINRKSWNHIGVS